MRSDSLCCTIFGEDLPWDSRRKSNGCLRLHACKLAEIMALERNLTPDRKEACTVFGCEVIPAFIVRWDSRSMRVPVFVFCCRKHMSELLMDHQEDALDDVFKVEHASKATM
jgi:hypothetical protein